MNNISRTAPNLHHASIGNSSSEHIAQEMTPASHGTTSAQLSTPPNRFAILSSEPPAIDRLSRRTFREGGRSPEQLTPPSPSRVSHRQSLQGPLMLTRMLNGTSNQVLLEPNMRSASLLHTDTDEHDFSLVPQRLFQHERSHEGMINGILSQSSSNSSASESSFSSNDFNENNFSPVTHELLHPEESQNFYDTQRMTSSTGLSGPVRLWSTNQPQPDFYPVSNEFIVETNEDFSEG